MRLRTFTVPGTYNPAQAFRYRVVAQNTVGYGLEFPTMTVSSMSAELPVGTVPLAPTNLAATLQAGPQVRLTWRDNAVNESGFAIERSDNGGPFVQIAIAPARNNTGNVTYHRYQRENCNHEQSHIPIVWLRSIRSAPPPTRIGQPSAVAVVAAPAAPSSADSSTASRPADRLDLDGQRQQ